MDDRTIAAICELFGLGAPLAAPVAVAGGLTNRVWRLTTERGIFAVKEMNRDLDRADYVDWFDRAFSLEQAAFAAGVPMPLPLPTAAGRCLAEVPQDNGPPATARVHAWVEGEKLDNGTAYPAETAARVAEILARIHALNMRAEVPPSEALRVFGEAHWEAVLERAQQAGAEWAADFAGLQPTLHELDEYVRTALTDETPLLLSHRDSDMKNFLRTPAADLVLVDWGGGGPVNPRHDVANHALVWAGVHRGDPDPAVARAFVAAYRRGGGVSGGFRSSDLAELVSVRLAWFDFNARRALGERVRDPSDRAAGVGTIRRNVTELPRFARSLDAWLATLGD